MIQSFADRDTERLFQRERVRRFPADLQRPLLRKLGLVDAAEQLEDLRVPPGNRLEKLKGDRAGQHSIRVNDQWRICFRWKDGNAGGVEIVHGTCAIADQRSSELRGAAPHVLVSLACSSAITSG